MSVKRTILQAIPVPELPGWENRLVLLEYPPGAAAVLHNHPSAGPNYIIEGNLISQWEGKEPEYLTAGDSFVDWADIPHLRAENASKDKPLKIVATYVIKIGTPNMVPLNQ